MSEKKVVEEFSKKEVCGPVKGNELSQDQALQILVQAAKLATKRGAFELEETDLLLQAVKVFQK